MFLESKSFIVRDLEEKDKENIRAVEDTRPWASVMNGLKGIIDKIPDAESPDLFEDLWNSYISSKKMWVIERKNNKFIGDITIDIDDEHEAHFYIQVLDNVNLEGFGKELLNAVIEEISKKFSISDFYIDLWDENDTSKPIYIEAGYDMEDGSLEINL